MRDPTTAAYAAGRSGSNERMEQPENEPAQDEPIGADLGEDHRGDPPGYDLDEQAAIEELEREQAEDE